jgi:aspartokinase
MPGYPLECSRSAAAAHPRRRYTDDMPSVSRLRRRVSFAQVIEGDLDCTNRRHCERSVMEHLMASGITLEAVAIESDGCSFIIDSRDADRFTDAVAELNVAVKLLDHCARVALTRAATDLPLPTIGRVMRAFDDESIDVVHLTGDATALTVVVADREADHVVDVLSRFYQRPGSNASGRLAS